MNDQCNKELMITIMLLEADTTIKIGEKLNLLSKIIKELK